MRKQIEAIRLDSLLITKPENLYYLTQLHLDSGALLVSRDKSFLLTDFRYAEEAKKYLKGIDIVVLDKISVSLAIKEICLKNKIKKLGFGASSLSFYQWEALKKSLPSCMLIPTHGLCESLRQVKDKYEIASIREAIKITNKVDVILRKYLRPGLKESKVAQKIRESIMAEGAEGLAFDPIVAGQPQACECHHKAGHVKLKSGEPVLIDMGARINGYNCDLTRVHFLGKINEQFTTVYKVLLDAQKRALEVLKPGTKISDVDIAARQYIAGKAFGKYFGHAIGHGIGLETHEAPTISSLNHTPLKEGMVFTIEPGIYMPGVGGLRVEDMVLVCKGGYKILTYDIDK